MCSSERSSRSAKVWHPQFTAWPTPLTSLDLSFHSTHGLRPPSQHHLHPRVRRGTTAHVFARAPFPGQPPPKICAPFCSLNENATCTFLESTTSPLPPGSPPAPPSSLNAMILTLPNILHLGTLVSFLLTPPHPESGVRATEHDAKPVSPQPHPCPQPTLLGDSCSRGKRGATFYTCVVSEISVQKCHIEGPSSPALESSERLPIPGPTVLFGGLQGCSLALKVLMREQEGVDPHLSPSDSSPTPTSGLLGPSCQPHERVTGLSQGSLLPSL